MNKIIIADYGAGNLGKTSSLRVVFEKLKTTYPGARIEKYTDTGDIRAVFHLKEGIRIGMETQGDPRSRMPGSMDLFVQEACDIIITACRTKGDTIQKVYELRDKHGYEIIWAQHIISSAGTNSPALLNEIYAGAVQTLIREVISGNL